MPFATPGAQKNGADRKMVAVRIRAFPSHSPSDEYLRDEQPLPTRSRFEKRSMGDVEY